MCGSFHDHCAAQKLNIRKNEIRPEVISRVRVLPIKIYIGRKECVGGMTFGRYVSE